MESRDIMYLDDVRLARAKALQTVQHAVVAAVMAGSGYSSLSGGDTSHRWVAILELAAAAALFASIALERRHRLRGSHARFGWIEIASGTLLFVEGLTKHRDGKWFHANYVSHSSSFSWESSRPASRDFAVSAARSRRRRRCSGRGSAPFRGFRIPWGEIARARQEDMRFTIELHDREEGRIVSDRSAFPRAQCRRRGRGIAARRERDPGRARVMRRRVDSLPVTSGER